MPTKVGVEMAANCKRLNDITVISRMPHAHNGEVFDSLGAGKVYSTYLCVLQSAYRLA